MKIKKPMTVKPAGGDGAPTGGATIADRFRLDVPEKKKGGGAAVNSTAAACAFSAALLALALLAGLVGMLYTHYDYLISA